MSKVVERFLKYIKYDTKSDENSFSTPSTEKQMLFAKELKKDLESIGMENVSLDSNGYVMAQISSNTDKKVKTIGFISHMDTSPEISGENVNPKIIENYNGEDIVLNEEKNIILSVRDFPEIKNYKGKTLITTDGTTLLGADDKAGVSEIITAMEYITSHPELEHGKICVAFTPDEEIGCGSDHFDVKKFNADFAYTIDGGTIGELEYENFNAAEAKIIVNGRNVHPGSAKNKMINSMKIAMELINSLPQEEVPEKTEGYEGFYHLTSLKGEVENTQLQYIIRDFYKKSFENRKNNIKKIVENLNIKYGNGTVKMDLKDQYYNMKEKIEPEKWIVNIAHRAIEEANVQPKVSPIRGGTDGARLSFMGLLTPNIFTGGHNFHGKYEYIPTFAMEKVIEVILNIIKLNCR